MDPRTLEQVFKHQLAARNASIVTWYMHTTPSARRGTLGGAFNRVKDAVMQAQPDNQLMQDLLLLCAYLQSDGNTCSGLPVASTCTVA
jgi:hypothetical protein